MEPRAQAAQPERVEGEVEGLSLNDDERHLPTSTQTVGKNNTQHIERKHLMLRTRLKRLARKTLCFSKSAFMHDAVIGLFVNRSEFGTLV